MNNEAMSYAMYLVARGPGPICERCNTYYGMTGEFHDASDKEFENAEKAVVFASNLSAWWTKDQKLVVDSVGTENFRDWPGTNDAAKWLRQKLNKEK